MRTAPAATVEELAEQVGTTGPVAILGGGTQGDLGGAVEPTVRFVKAPVGIVDHQPTEMTVRVGAGTPVADIDRALAATGQCVAIPDRPGSTVGGAVAGGRSGIRRLGWGPVRDTVLELRYVDAWGRVVTAGAPLVKNVSGFDLCRLFVGSLGTLGFIGEAVLRTRPTPRCEAWLSGAADPFEALDLLYAPLAVLWDGTTTWVLLAGDEADVEREAGVVAPLGLAAAVGPPTPPRGAGRRSCHPGDLRGLDPTTDGPFLAHVGVGIVESPRLPIDPVLDPALVELHRRVKAEFDPDGRLNPGQSVLPGPAGVLPPRAGSGRGGTP